MRRDRHILFVEMGTGFGGSTRCLLSLVEMCAANGWRSSVAVGYPIPALEQGRAPCTTLRLYESRAWRTGQRLRRLSARSDSRGGRARSLAGFAASALLADLPLAALLAGYARRRGVDLIHANNELLVNRTAILAGCLGGLPVISHQRGWAWPSRASRWLARRVRRVVAISDFVRQSLIEAGVPVERIERVYDGVDCARFGGAQRLRDRARGEFGFHRQDEVVGLPAVLLPWKGHEMFLEAFARLAAARPRLRALLVGASPSTVGDFAPRLRARIAALGLHDRVRMVGHVEDMARAYAAMDIVVHASQRPEPFGLVVVEALAAGRPVVAAGAGGPAEVIRHERDGWLYRPGDAAALAAALATLLDRPALRSELAARAPDRAAGFDVGANWRGVSALYEGVIRRRRVAANEPPTPGTDRAGRSSPA